MNEYTFPSSVSRNTAPSEPPSSSYCPPFLYSRRGEFYAVPGEEQEAPTIHGSSSFRQRTNTSCHSPPNINSNDFFKSSIVSLEECTFEDAIISIFDGEQQEQALEPTPIHPQLENATGANSSAGIVSLAGTTRSFSSMMGGGGRSQNLSRNSSISSTGSERPGKMERTISQQQQDEEPHCRHQSMVFETPFEPIPIREFDDSCSGTSSAAASIPSIVESRSSRTTTSTRRVVSSMMSSSISCTTPHQQYMSMCSPSLPANELNQIYHPHHDHQESGAVPPAVPTSSDLVAFNNNNNNNNTRSNKEDNSSRTNHNNTRNFNKPHSILPCHFKSNNTKQQQQQQPKLRFYQKERWWKRYDELVAFVRKHGQHSIAEVADIEKENKELARWVKRQRLQYRRRMKQQQGLSSSMTSERVRALEEINFVWDSHEAAWEDHFKDLEAFRSEHNHCNVPSTYAKNPSLAAWVKCQRRQYRIFQDGDEEEGTATTTTTSTMTMDRILRLESMGFRWSFRK